MPYAPELIAAQAPASERTAFIRKTYLHLGGAVLVFIALEAALLHSALAEPLVRTLLGGRMSWFIVLAAFMGIGYLAQRWAQSGTSVPMQYLGLGLYVVAEAVIMLPLLFVAAFLAKEPNLIAMAGIYTGLIFTGLTGTVFFTGHDFSWMRQALIVAGLAALGVIVASLLFGFSLGALFSAIMIAVAAGYVLYYTSNVLHHYPVGSHVAAALALFSAVALLFWYVLRLLMSLNRR